MKRTSTPAANTRMKSTSFARAAGRPRSTFIAASNPRRIDAIIPDAPQRRAMSEMKPIAESGLAIPSIDCETSVCPDSETGRMSTISSITSARSSSSCSTSPKTATRAMVSGKSENSTR